MYQELDSTTRVRLAYLEFKRSKNLLLHQAETQGKKVRDLEQAILSRWQVTSEDLDRYHILAFREKLKSEDD